MKFTVFGISTKFSVGKTSVGVPLENMLSFGKFLQGIVLTGLIHKKCFISKISNAMAFQKFLQKEATFSSNHFDKNLSSPSLEIKWWW